MRFFMRVSIYFYVLVISLGSGLAILFVSHTFPFEDFVYYLEIAYNVPRIRLIVGLISTALILVSFIFEKIIIDRKEKERTIAFDNPSGRVSISLSAVEDLVRRVISHVPEVKEVKADIVATKRGIEIESRLILKADVNIPDMTLKLQEMIKNRIQEILGIDETVTVRIHVVKIFTEEGKGKQGKEPKEEKDAPIIPFRGYRV